MSRTQHVIGKLNEELKQKFKIAIAINRESQNEAVKRMVQHYVDTNGKLTTKKNQ
jgi:hypothetical protein